MPISSTVKITIGVVAGFVLLFLAAITIAVSVYFSMSNREHDLRNLAEAKQKACYLVHDEMWKSVKEIGNVSESYKRGFDSIYTNIISARYAKGDGSLMKFIQESNPQFDVRLYDKLANVIEAKRSEFTVSQKELLDVAREHKSLLQNGLGPLVLGGRQPIVVELVTSDRTKASFASGVDNDVYSPGK